MKPLVSVIVPAYNYGHFLGQTLASVQAQTHRHWECLVIDDGSTDDTWEVALAHAHDDERIRYLRRTNGGLPAARNTGLRELKGDYVQFLDADDLIEPRKLEIQVDYLEARREVAIVYGDMRYFDSDAPRELRLRMFGGDVPWMPQVSGSGHSVLRSLICANIMVVSSPLVRRELVDKVGLFDEALASLEDWDYWMRCAASGAQFRFLDAEGTLALVRVHRRSMSQNRLQMQRQEVMIRKDIHPAKFGEEIFVQNRWRLTEELGRLGKELLRQRRRLASAQHYLEAGLTSPNGSKWIKKALLALLLFQSKDD